MEAVKHVCEHNNAIKQYLGDRLQSIGENKKLRALHDRFTDKAGNNHYKRSRSGLTVVIKSMNPLVLVKAGKQQKEEETQESPQQRRVVQELDRSIGSNRSTEPPQELQSQLIMAMDKAMLESDGKTNRGYFTASDLAYWLMIRPNQHWTEDSAKEQIDKWLLEGKIEEIESGKYSPKRETQID